MRDRRKLAIAVLSALTFLAVGVQAANGLRMVSDKWPLTGYRMFAGGGATARYEIQAVTANGSMFPIRGRDFGINGRQLRHYLGLRAAAKPQGAVRVRLRLADLAAVWNRDHRDDPITSITARVYTVPPPPEKEHLDAVVAWASP